MAQSPMLFFKSHFLPLIRSGAKTQTIRLWKSPRVKKGACTLVPGLGHIKIIHIDILPSLSALTPADAHADGFPSRRALLAALRDLYAHIPDKSNRHIYRIQFKFPARAHVTPRKSVPTPKPQPKPRHPPLPITNYQLQPALSRARPKSKFKNPKSKIHPPSRHSLARFLRALAPHMHA